MIAPPKEIPIPVLSLTFAWTMLATLGGPYVMRFIQSDTLYVALAPAIIASAIFVSTIIIIGGYFVLSALAQRLTHLHLR